MAGNERHTKGILVRRNQVFQQGFFSKNKIEPGNSFEVVDMLSNRNDKEREDRLSRNLQRKLEKQVQVVNTSFSVDLENEIPLDGG